MTPVASSDTNYDDDDEVSQLSDDDVPVPEEVAVAGTGVDYDVLFSLILNYVSF